MNGKPDGKGEYIWKDQSKYEGDFCGGLRHGHGFWQKSLNNKSLSIKIENQNAISGKQSLKSECYTGGYVNDKKSGYGVFRWASGAIYEGEYFDDQRQGYGEMYNLNTFKGVGQMDHVTKVNGPVVYNVKKENLIALGIRLRGSNKRTVK